MGGGPDEWLETLRQNKFLSEPDMKVGWSGFAL